MSKSWFDLRIEVEEIVRQFSEDLILPQMPSILSNEQIIAVLENVKLELGQERGLKMKIHKQFRDTIVSLKKEVEGPIMIMGDPETKLRSLVKKIEAITIPSCIM